MTIGPRVIAASTSCRQTNDIWRLFLGHVETLQPFWATCIDHFSRLTGFDSNKRTSHLKSAGNAFALMDDWRLARVKHVKARRNEIDSAISFVRNAALQNPVSSLRAAAAARNAASALRITLTSACHGYRDDQLPELFAHAIFDIAAVRVRFPFDFGTLTCFHPGHSEGASADDPFMVMLERAAQKTSRTKELRELLMEVEHLYAQIESPQPISDIDWFEDVDDSNARLYYAAQAAFHSA